MCIFRNKDIDVDSSIYSTTDDDTVRIVQANQPKTAIKSSSNDGYELEAEDVESHEEEKVNYSGKFSRGPIFLQGAQFS